MYVRLAFAVAVHVDPDILLVDEVLAVGDEPFQAKCLAKIDEFKREGRTIVLVSHSSGQVADICNRALVLEKGELIEDGDVIVALGRLRKDYQGQIEATRRAADDQVSAYSARIRRVYLTGEPEAYHHADFQVVARPGVTLLVHCEIEFDTPTPDWSIAAAIETTLGEERLQTDSKTKLQQDLPLGVGVQELVIRFPDLRLGHGEFVVNLSVDDADGVRLATLPRAALFAIRHAHRASGPVYSEVSIEFPAAD
jgi:ABC-2 type transport system ATP-binding protein